MTQTVAEQKSTQQEIHMVVVSNDPTRVYPAVTLALGAAALGTKVHIYCTMSGWDVIKKDAGEKIKLPGMPPLDQYVKDAIGAGATVCACAPSAQMLSQLGIDESTIIPGVKIEDVVGFLNNALPAAKDGGIVLFV